MNTKKYDFIRIFFNNGQKEIHKCGTTEDIQEALNYAVINADLDTVKEFVKLGAKVDYNNSMALQVATMIKSPYYSNEKILQYLINEGANVDSIRDTMHPAINQWIKDNY